MKRKLDDTRTLKSLGSGKTKYVTAGGEIRPDVLETFPNANKGREYWISFIQPEHSSLCPKTGQPDTAVITIDYVPDVLCVESKSLKLYLGSYRSAGVFMETSTNQIITDLVALLKPMRMVVQGNFAPRGGIRTVVTVRYEQDEGCVAETALQHKIGLGDA